MHQQGSPLSPEAEKALADKFACGFERAPARRTTDELTEADLREIDSQHDEVQQLRRAGLL